MSHSLLRVLAPAIICVALAAPAAAQAPSGVMEDLLKDVKEAKGKIVGLAKAMPDAAWDWRPAPGVRSTREVFVHVTADNYFIPVGAGSTRRPAPASARTTRRSRRSRSGRGRASRPRRARHVVRVPRAADDRDHRREARDAVEVAEESTRQLWIASTTHLHEHLGQLIAYAAATRSRRPGPSRRSLVPRRARRPTCARSWSRNVSIVAP